VLTLGVFSSLKLFLKDYQEARGIFFYLGEKDYFFDGIKVLSLPKHLGQLPELLSVFYNGRCMLDEVVYMPYYRCKFTDEKGRYRFMEYTPLKQIEDG